MECGSELNLIVLTAVSDIRSYEHGDIACIYTLGLCGSDTLG